MSNAALIILWNDAKTGREKMAGELFNSALSFCDQKVKEGVMDSFEPVVLDRHCGAMNGFITMRGDVTKLEALSHSSAFKDLAAKATLCLTGYGVVEAHLGNDLNDYMKRWASNIPR